MITPVKIHEILPELKDKVILKVEATYDQALDENSVYLIHFTDKTTLVIQYDGSTNLYLKRSK